MALRDLLLWLWMCFVLGHAAVHDELPQCGITGVYRQRQSVIESPNYPDNYPINTCLDYVIRSPYRCPTKFHIQFLDFNLELSENCTKDYLAVGLEHDGEDMDVLCGQVVGIKKYHTPDGVLRLRFLSDDSPWTTGRGFKLLITRLACEREDLPRGLDVDVDGDVDDDTVAVNAKFPNKLQVLHNNQAALFQNFSQQDQHRPLLLPPVFGGYNNPSQYPGLSYLPSAAPVNGFGGLVWPGVGQGQAQAWPAAGTQPTHAPLQQQQPCLDANQLKSLQQLQQGLQQQQQGLQQQGLQTQQQQQLLQQQQQQGLQQQQALQQQQSLQQLSLQQQLLQQKPGLQLQPGSQQQQQQQFLQQQQQQQAVEQQQLPAISDQYQTPAFQTPTLKDYDPESLQQFGGQVDLCCATSFSQSHFYLSSPGFPRTVFNALLPTQQRDCAFYLEKSSPNVCRLRIQFKFFDFGHSNNNGGAAPPQLVGQRSCSDDFIEVDGQRYCGCRSGFVHKSYWGQGRKVLRMRMGYAGVPANGFLLEVFQDQDQDGCRDTTPFGLGGGQQTPGIPLAGAGQQLGQQPFGQQLGQQLGQPFGQQSGQQLGQQFGQPFGQQLGQQLGQPFGQQSGQQFGQQFAQPFGQQPAQQFGLQSGPQFGQHLGAPTAIGLWPQLPYQPVLAPSLAHNQPIWPQTALPYRQTRRVAWARGLDAHQPARVVETNSTRKEFYYFDGDQAFARAALDSDADVDATDEPNENVGNRLSTKAFEHSSCSFDYMEVLKLSVDTLWLTKPLCFAPLRNWFSNIFG